jgi:hypothetical protein
VSEDGQIAGADLSGGLYWASRTGATVSLPNPAGYVADASAVSMDGVVVGRAEGASGSVAVAWRVTGGSVFGPVVLGVGGASDVAVSGATTNRVVGFSTSGPSAQAATWDITLLAGGQFSASAPTIIVSAPSVGEAITDSGDVAGVMLSDSRPFVLRGTSLTILEGTRGTQLAVGYDLNDTDVVGYARETRRGVATHRAARWNSTGQYSSLLGSEWAEGVATAINLDGSIVGFGRTSASTPWRAWIIR